MLVYQRVHFFFEETHDADAVIVWTASSQLDTIGTLNMLDFSLNDSRIMKLNPEIHPQNPHGADKLLSNGNSSIGSEFWILTLR